MADFNKVTKWACCEDVANELEDREIDIDEIEQTDFNKIVNLYQERRNPNWSDILDDCIREVLHL